MRISDWSSDVCSSDLDRGGCGAGDEEGGGALSMLILFMFAALVAMICLNVPIAVALAIAAVIGLVASEGPPRPVALGLDMYNGDTHFALIDLPMFVLAGELGRPSRRERVG